MPERVYELEPILKIIEDWVVTRQVPGEPPGTVLLDEKHGVDVYGVSDIICILYTIRRLDLIRKQQNRWIKAIQRFQDPDSGVFITKLEDSVGRQSEVRRNHCAAFAVAALELLDARPLHPLRFLEPLKDYENLIAWMEGCDWKHPYHSPNRSPTYRGGGWVACVASIFAILGGVDVQWFAKFFDWLDKEQDPKSGMWRRGYFDQATAQQLGAAFHIYFVYEHMHRPIHYADQIIDATLSLQQENGSFFGDWPRWAYLDLDGAYALARMSRAAVHRRKEVRTALSRLLDYTMERLHDEEDRKKLLEGDLNTHQTLGTLTCLAVLQEVLPERFRTSHILRNVLDRRPFI